MRGNSYLFDSLKLTLRDKYTMSDREIETLSDIVLKYNLAELVQEGYLLTLIHLMDSWGLKFPISYKFMKDKWTAENLTFNFEYILSRFIESKLLTLRRVTEATFFSSANINKSAEDLHGEDYYIVVYGTQTYNDFISEVTPLLHKVTESVNEAFMFTEVNSKFGRLLDRLKDDFKRGLNLLLGLESFTEDVLKNESEMFLTIQMKDKLKDLKDSDLLRIAKKTILKDSSVKEVDIYKDGDSEVVLNLVLDKRATASQLFRVADGVTDAFEEIVGIKK